MNYLNKTIYLFNYKPFLARVSSSRSGSGSGGGGGGVQNMPGIQTWLLTNPEDPSLQFFAYVAQMSKASSSHECSIVQPQKP